MTLVVPVVLLQAVTAAGWFRLNGMWPARQGIALAALGGFVADAAMLAAAGGTAPAVLAGTLGGFFLLVLILQIFRPSNPDERFYALTVSASATLMTVLAACFTAAVTLTHHGWSSGAVVTTGALAAGVATLVSAVPKLPAPAAFAAGAVAGLLCGVGVGSASGLGLPAAALLGLAAGGCALIGRRVAAYDFPSRFVHFTAGIAVRLAWPPDGLPGRAAVRRLTSADNCHLPVVIRQSSSDMRHPISGSRQSASGSCQLSAVSRDRSAGVLAGQPWLPGPTSSDTSPWKGSTCEPYDVC
ncbi:hypothetical protein GXW82_35165 [Streptacidiphilus sp. 4-A2]|nr:hypothetical protein [Streptacidiphilus sp. 4-A2]